MIPLLCLAVAVFLSAMWLCRRGSAPWLCGTALVVSIVLASHARGEELHLAGLRGATVPPVVADGGPVCLDRLRADHSHADIGDAPTVELAALRLKSTPKPPPHAAPPPIVNPPPTTGWTVATGGCIQTPQGPVCPAKPKRRRLFQP